MRQIRILLFLTLSIATSSNAFAQFNLAGNAISTGGGCYTLTNATGQSGAIWNTTQINLNQTFDITLVLNFGCNSTSDDFNLAPNCGGDGMSFILQPNNTGVVGSGGQVGFGGITPSLGVVMDDYTNGPDDNAAFDGVVDHISLNTNGNVIHGTANELIAPAVGAGNGFPSELENCNNYSFRFRWVPGSPNGTLQVWFNGGLMFTYTGDIINNVFGGNPNVYWGVGGSTGACWNTQTVCMAIAADFTNNTVCSGTPTTFTNQSVSSSPFTSYLWNFGDGQTSTLQNPTHTYAAPGTYNVTLTVTNSAGLTSTISNVVTVIGVTTTASASPASICVGQSSTLTGTVSPVPATVNQNPSFTNTTDYAITDGGVTFGWTGTGGTFAQSNIAVTGINAGWSVNSVCLNINHTWDGDVIIYLKDPCGNLVQLCSGAGGSGDNFTNTCFTPTAATAITAGTAPFSGSYSPSGGAGIWTTLSGCATPNGTWSLLVGDQTSTDAGTLLDWTITFNNPVTATYTYAWNPGNITNTLTPVVTPATTTTYTLTATSSLGCTSTSTVVVTVNPGPTVTVNSPTICNGTTATLTANGATTYAWSSGLGAGNPKTVNPAATTTYTVTGTTAGCTGTATSVVTVNPLPTVTTTPATICAGQTATISAAGANTYAWSSGGTGASTTVTPAATTTYTVTGTSAAGCTKTATVVVTVNPLPTVTTIPATICAGATATISAAGANTYSWSSGGTGASTTVTPAATTTYTVTGTSAAGCSNTATVVVTVNPLPTVTTTPATICNGTTATISAAGANTYAWSSGGTGASTTVTPAVTTTYTVTGTSAAGCSNTATVVVTVNPNPVVTVNNPSVCAGVTTTLTANGATTYSWSTGATTNPITVTPAINTTYTVTGTTLGCTGTAVSVVTISPNATITVNSPTICAGQTATLTAAGASTYVWTGGLTGNPATTSPATTTTYTVTGTTALGCTGSTTSVVTVNPNPVVTVNSPTICNGVTATLTAAGATTYSWNTGATTNPITVTPGTTTTYTVTGTSLGCTGTATAIVTVNPLPVVTTTPATICNGSTATISAAGANTYAWSSGGTGTSTTVTPATTSTYTVTGTSAAGCTGTATVVVTVNPLPVVTTTPVTICEGTTATITASGANTYNWSSGGTGASTTVTPATTSTYTVTGTTSAGCSSTATLIVTVNPNPVITVNSPTVCNGVTATLTANSTVGGTTFVWNGGSTANPYSVTPAVTTTYTVTGTALGCTGSATTVVTVNPNPVVTVNNATICIAGTATLTAASTVGGTTYQWNTGSTTNPLTVSPAINTTYTVTGTAAGCTGTATASVTITPSAVISVNAPVLCEGETATLNASGGVNYSWNTGANFNPITVTPAVTTTYSVTGTDASGCVGSTTAIVVVNPNPVVTTTPSVICAGQSATLTVLGASNYSWNTGSTANPYIVSPTVTTTYTVTGTTLGCTGSATGVVTVNPNPAVTVNNAAICAGFTTTLNANGAAGYNWSSGETTASINVSPAVTTTYTITGTTLGCTGTATSVVTVYMNPTPAVTTTDEHCGQSDGTATATAGFANYAWTPAGATQTLTGLSANTYTVTVTDSYGCTGTASGTVGFVNGPTASWGIVTQETCTAGNGLLSVNVNGGTPNYVYTWSPAGSNTNTNANLHAGNYSVTVTDNWGCTVMLDTSITDSPAPVLSVGSITPASCGSSDGGATLNINLGTPVFQFLWSNSNTSQNLQNASAGYYTVTVTDASGCTGTIGLTINELAGPGVTASGQTAFCGLPNGSAVAMGTGGSGNYTYQWSNGPNTAAITALYPGTYVVTVTDGNCSATTSVVIGDIPGPNADFSFTPQIATLDNPEFTFSDNSSGGPVLWEWEFGDGSTSSMQDPVHTYGDAGTYTVMLTVENSMGCRDSTLREVTVKGNILIWVPNAFTPNNDGSNDTFGPKGTGIDPDRYQFYIFNRWGEELFHSTDINLQWDGRYRGNLVKPDTYVWMIVYKGEKDKMQKLEGHVTVVK